MEEFGRTPGCIGNVLAVLGDGEEAMQRTLDAAVDLAQATNARLTLVGICEQARAYVWVAPFAVGSAYLPAELESPEEAARALCRLADRVPDSVPVTTLVLTEDTQEGLLKLLKRSHFGAVVADAGLLSRCRRVRRALQCEQLYTVSVDSDRGRDGSGAASPGSPSGINQGGAAAAAALGYGARGRRDAGWRPWNARRLARAGGGE